MQSLTLDSLVFSRLMDEYGNAKDNRKERTGGIAKNGIEPLQFKPDSAEDVLMQLEERNVGAVSWDVYKKYLRFSGGLIWAPVILALLILTQANQGLSRIYSKCFMLIPAYQLPRLCFLDFGREILYLASHKAVTWAYMLR